ncbi:DUF885 domain-containing protein [Sanguibacter hominis ATCC BAA-789]|uniref:DUF885 domain-containing protein n=1 Tax=Sanguibacter hominis ATCC BAA-789 TaxID=1312740 RepID=A0A9X5FBG6_9MICO|nr:DUF885 domain-containing protein [Sanguibacter hominis]NKX91962.1 DUF885 domain-containing protein [Sanguibacter hominis ATCC BAA-789]
MTATPAARPASDVDRVAEAHLEAVCRLDPVAATSMGVAGYDGEVPDLSPAGVEARATAARATLDAVASLDPATFDDVDRVTVAALRERLGLEVELADAGETLAPLNVIASPVQDLRDVLDLMPTGTVEAWENVASRLGGLPTAIDGYVESLRLAASRGEVAAVRQVAACAQQARELADPSSGFFASFVSGPEVDAVLDPSSSCALLRRELESAAQDAAAAYGRLADVLEQELAPQAPTVDAVGEERYSLWSRYFLGARVDLRETYEWGLEELARVVADQERTAARVAGPGASVEDAVARLDADPAYRLDGTHALRRWMQETSDAAIAALDGVHFDIPEPVRTLECRIAPTQTGGIYYTGPSDDFSRPGRMWWSVPASVTSFSTWRERTTVYHEGVPGHHLQVGQAVYERATLNSWRRLACWTSGHGEGWALYAERLMQDLGFLDDPGDLLGMLDGQRMRAARVVLDIGVHLGLPCPERWGGGTWDAAKAWEFLRANVNMPEDFVRFELDRYLGWPGQAPSYKVGQRLWEQARDGARAAATTRGEDFDLKAFHARALRMGSVGLDVLRDELAR